MRKVVEQGGKIVIGDVNEVGGQALAAELGGDKKAVFLRCDVWCAPAEQASGQS